MGDSGEEMRGRIISIDYCRGVPETESEQLKEQLQRAIPGVTVQLNFNPLRERFCAREGSHDFFREEGPGVESRVLGEKWRTAVVNNVLTFDYLPDEKMEY